MRQHLASAQVTKKQNTYEDEMISVTISYIWLKCYLNFYKIVAEGMRSSKVLARAIGNEYLFLIKKLNENVYSFFKFTIMLLSSALTSQHNRSSLVNSKIPTISEGIVVRSDFERGFCWITFDLTSNNFIPPFMLFFINIFDNILYIFYPQLIQL